MTKAGIPPSLPTGTRIRHFTIPQQGEGTLEITVSDLEIDPEVGPDTFRMKMPKGYEKIDDFAP